MKIAHVVCVYPPYKGGIGNVCKNFVDGLDGLGHDVAVFTPDYGRKGGENNNIKVVRVKTLGRLGNGAFIPSIIFKLKDFDIIHLHYPFFGGIEPVYLSKIFNKKVKLIIHYHMDVFGLGIIAKVLSIPSLLISGLLFKSADAITCASIDYVQNSSINKVYKKYKHKFHEIPFGVDVDRFYPKKDKHLQKTKRMLFVGGLDNAHYFKGLDILFRSLVLLKEKRDDWILEIVGSGDLENNYINMIKELGLESKVNFYGNVSNEDLPGIYRRSDLLILPSINSNEAFGLVLLEAMASGISVIASDLPGVRTVFKNGKQGLLVRPGSKNDLKDKIIKMLDSDLKDGMGEAGRELVKQKYDWNVVIKKLEKLYENMCSK